MYEIRKLVMAILHWKQGLLYDKLWIHNYVTIFLVICITEMTLTFFFCQSMEHLLYDDDWLSTDGGWLSTDRGWLSTDGGWLSTDGGWLSTDGGWLSTDCGWLSTDGGCLCKTEVRWMLHTGINTQRTFRHTACH